jgi:uncharacterized protein YfaS (alpha-2-macroglobulin family)
MTTIRVYQEGDLVRATGVFKNAADVAIDPTTVRFKFTKPNGVQTTYLYLTDVQLVRDSTGNYHVDISADLPGEWYYRWESTGNGQAAEDHQFTVAPSAQP